MRNSKQKIKNRKKPNLKISKIIKNEIAKTKKSAAEKKLFSSTLPVKSFRRNYVIINGLPPGNNINLAFRN